MDRLATRQKGVKGRQRNIIHYVDVPGRRALRSAGTNRLAVPPVRLATVGSELYRSPLPTPGTLFHSTSSQLLRCSHLNVI